MWMLSALLGLAACLVFVYWHTQAKKPGVSQSEEKEKEKDPITLVKEKETSARAKQPYDYFLVLDVEATCVAGADFSWPNEIIEWPVILLRWTDRDEDGKASRLEVVDEFRSFVKPTWRPVLSEFCRTLTGISQMQVDSAPTFPDVLDDFKKFLTRNGLLCSESGKRLEKFAWATDGPFDIRDFVAKQCFISKIKVPEYLTGNVVDVRKLVAEWIAKTQQIPSKNPSKWSPAQTLNISRQLAALSLPPFQGRQHSGIDDTRNIGRILTELARRGVRLEPNLRIQPGRKWYWMGEELGQVIETYFT